MSAIHSDQPRILIADAVVYSADRQLQLIVEIKSRSGTSTAWAVQLLRYLFDDAGSARAPYILLTTLDYFYLWHNVQDPAKLPEPEYVANAADMLADYFKHSPSGMHGASRFGFEMAVTSWLYDLFGPQGDRLADKEGNAWLRDSGLLAVVTGGSVAIEPRL